MEKEFIELIKKHEGILYKICNIFFFRNIYKEDYYQEILIRVWKSFRGFKNQSTFATWLYRVALNSAIDIKRKEKLQPLFIRLTDYEYDIPVHENLNDSDKKDKLYRAISQLSDVEKAIIILWLEDYNYKEISEITGISESNTGVRINRIKNQLIKILNNGEK